MGVVVSKDRSQILILESKPSDTSNQSLDCALCILEKCHNSEKSTAQIQLKLEIRLIPGKQSTLKYISA